MFFFVFCFGSLLLVHRLILPLKDKWPIVTLTCNVASQTLSELFAIATGAAFCCLKCSLMCATASVAPRRTFQLHSLYFNCILNAYGTLKRSAVPRK